MKNKIIISIMVLTLISLVVIVFLYPRKAVQIPINVVSSIPKNNAVFVDEKAEIIFTLNRNLEPNQGDFLKIKISPEDKINISYQENKIKISPNTSFEINVDYEIKVFFRESEIYKFNFETTPFTSNQIQEEGSKQSNADLDFNQSYEQFLRNYPWYSKIPIENKDYIIVYDFEKSSFKIIFKNKKLTENEKELLTKSAVEKIENLGVKMPVKYYSL